MIIYSKYKLSINSLLKSIFIGFLPILLNTSSQAANIKSYFVIKVEKKPIITSVDIDQTTVSKHANIANAKPPIIVDAPKEEITLATESKIVTENAKSNDIQIIKDIKIPENIKVTIPTTAIEQNSMLTSSIIDSNTHETQIEDIREEKIHVEEVKAEEAKVEEKLLQPEPKTELEKNNIIQIPASTLSPEQHVTDSKNVWQPPSDSVLRSINQNRRNNKYGQNPYIYRGDN